MLTFVPNGMADFADMLGRRMGKQVVRLFRPEGAPRADMRYVELADDALAREADSICALEDVSRTGFSAHVTAGVLRRNNPNLDVHTLSMLQRDAVNPAYQAGPGAAIYHTFVRRDIPLTLEEFQQQFPGVSVTAVV